MAALYGHTWVSQYGASPDGVGADTWSGVLADMSPSQIATGLREATAQGKEWPPSAPRFRALCLGIPSLAAMRAEHRNGCGRDEKPTGFFRLLWSFLDPYRFRMADADKADRMFADAYEMASDHVMRGKPLPADPSALLEAKEPEKVKPADPANVKRYLGELNALLGEPQA